MIEMSEADYRKSGLVQVTWFVVAAPFAAAARRGTLSAWLVTVPLGVLYELFALPLVAGSVVAVLLLTSPMLLIAGVVRLLRLVRRG